MRDRSFLLMLLVVSLVVLGIDLQRSAGEDKSATAPPKLEAIVPAAPPIAPNEPLVIIGSGFRDKVAVTLTDPQGNRYEVPGTDVVSVTPERVVVVVTLGIGGQWKARMTNPGGTFPSNELTFAVANSPLVNAKSPPFWMFVAAAFVITSVLVGLLIVFLVKLGAEGTSGHWSLAGALSEESAFQPNEITKKEDVIMVPSASRLIALLGLLGILTLVLGVGYAIMWNLFIYGTIPDLGRAQALLFGAATLFIPYLASKLGEIFAPEARGAPPAPPPADSSGARISGAAPAVPRVAMTAQSLLVTGDGFQRGLTLTLTDPQGVAHALSGTNITATEPTLVVTNAVLNTPGAWRMTVTNPRTEPSTAWSFTVLGAPTVTGIEPTALARNVTAQQFVLVGSGFMLAPTVNLMGPRAPLSADIVSVTPTQVTVKAALTDAGQWRVVVTNPPNDPSAEFAFVVS